VTPSAAQATVCSQLADHVLMALPKKTTLSRSLRRHRQKAAESWNDPMPPIPIDCNFVMPERFSDFVQYDSGVEEDRLIIFGCTALLDGVVRAPVWLADETFKVVPLLFFQLYTLHFQFVQGINPSAGVDTLAAGVY